MRGQIVPRRLRSSAAQAQIESLPRGPEIPGDCRCGAESLGRVFPYFGSTKPRCGFGVSGFSSFNGMFDATSVFGSGDGGGCDAFACGAGALGSSFLGCGCTSGCG